MSASRLALVCICLKLRPLFWMTEHKKIPGSVRFFPEWEFQHRYPGCSEQSTTENVKVFDETALPPDLTQTAALPFWRQAPSRLLAYQPFTTSGPLCVPWNQQPTNETALRAWILNGVFLGRLNTSWLLLTWLLFFTHLTILPVKRRWLWWIAFAIVFRLTWRTETRPLYEALPRLGHHAYEALRRGGERKFRLNMRRGNRLTLWLLQSQQNVLIPIYCFFNFGSAVTVILFTHFTLTVYLRNRVAKMSTHHILGPLGLDWEIFWLIAATQFSKFIAIRVLGVKGVD